MTAPRVVNVGSAVVDHVYRVNVLPQPGEEKTADAYSRLAGGGFNMMVAAVRGGIEVAFAGQHGSGPHGDFLRAAFQTEGIETLTPKSAAMDSGNCTVIVTTDAERTFVSWPGAEGVLSPQLLDQIPLAAGDWVFTSGYTLSYPGSRNALADWIESLPPQHPFVFDPAPVVGDIPRAILTKVLARTTWLSCNSREAAAIAGAGDVRTLAARLLDTHCQAAAGVVIRSGEQGCFVRLAGGRSEMIPGFEVEAIDTNGAGDTHIGAFVSALVRGRDPLDAARYANAAAAIAVTRHGGSAAPTDAETNAFLDLHRAKTLARTGSEIHA